MTTRHLPGVAGGLDVEPAGLAYLSQPTRYTDENTQRALAGTDVRCPLFSSYVDRLVAYAREHVGDGAGAMA